MDPTEGGGAGGEYSRVCPAAQLPAQVSTGAHEYPPSSSLPHHPLHADDKEKNAPSYSLRRSLLFIQYISGAKHLKEPNSVPFE